MIKALTVVAVIAIFGTEVQCQFRMPLGLGMGMGGVLPMGMALGQDIMNTRNFLDLDNAVKSIFGPTAQPTPPMILLAAQQGGTPRTAMEMLPYLALFQAMSRDRNVTIPGVRGEPTQSQVDEYISDKLLSWIKDRTMMGTMTDQPEFAMRIQASGGMLGGRPNMPMGAGSNPMMMRALMSGGGQGLNPMDTYLALGAMS